jgi:hypothetical protein
LLLAERLPPTARTTAAETPTQAGTTAAAYTHRHWHLTASFAGKLGKKGNRRWVMPVYASNFKADMDQHLGKTAFRLVPTAI